MVKSFFGKENNCLGKACYPFCKTMKKCLLFFLVLLPVSVYSQNVKGIKDSKVSKEKRVASLRMLPKLGRTAAELELIWGAPLGEGTIYGQRFRGLRKDHRKYFPRAWSGSLYEVDNLMLYVSFYAGKSIAIGFSHPHGALPFEDVEKIARALTKSGFGARPADTSGYFSVYSNGSQQYLLQKGSGYVVMDMRMVQKEAENPNPEVRTDNL